MPELPQGTPPDVVARIDQEFKKIDESYPFPPHDYAAEPPEPPHAGISIPPDEVAQRLAELKLRADIENTFSDPTVNQLNN